MTSHALAGLLDLVGELHARTANVEGLESLFRVIWFRSRDAAWNVAELRADGALQGWSARKLGHALARLVDECDGRCGEFKLRRLGRDKSGAVWKLERW